MDRSEIIERIIHASRLKQYEEQISKSANNVNIAAAKIPLNGERGTAHLSDELTSPAQEPYNTLVGVEEDLNKLRRAINEKRKAVRSPLDVVTDQEMIHAINDWMERTAGGDDAPPEELEAVRAELDRLQDSPEV